MARPDLIQKIIDLQRQMYRLLEDVDPSPWLKLNLTTGQLRILFLLSLNGEMTPGTVASALAVPKGNVTGIIERLVRQGLVVRRQGGNDRRSYVLSLTPKGRQEVEQFREFGSTRMQRVLQKMAEPDLRAYGASLEALLKAAERKPSEAL